ncbi:MAG: hypothetical protein JXJ22_16000, partial [Bacteroidales bacterium]|nr:hypothetical protein [Bacteroidales bacterium]
MKSLIRYTLLTFVLSITGITLMGQQRYWVNGSGDWSDPMHWSETSGGSGGAEVPTPVNDVIIDNNSFYADGQYINIDQIAFGNNITWGKTGYKSVLKGIGYIVIKGTIDVVGKIENQFTGKIISFSNYSFSNNNLEAVPELYDKDFNRLIPLKKASKALFTVAIIDTINETCYRSKDGSLIGAVTSPGSPPYDYAWYMVKFPADSLVGLVWDKNDLTDTITGLRGGKTYYLGVQDDDMDVYYSLPVKIKAATKIIPDILAGGVSSDTGKACILKNLTLDGNPSGGQGVYKTHVWTGPGAKFLNDTTIVNPVFNHNVTGSYKLFYTATDTNNCVGTDSIIVTVYDVPTVDAGLNDTTCQNVSHLVFGTSATNYSSLSWAHNGAGSLSDATTLTPTYNPVAGDAGNTVRLTFQVNGLANCDPVTDFMDLYIQRQPDPDAGDNDSICVSGSFTVSTATASNYSTLSWSHNGTGGLLNGNTLTPTYNPGAGDGGNVVRLTLQANGNSNCAAATDFMDLTVRRNPS